MATWFLKDTNVEYWISSLSLQLYLYAGNFSYTSRDNGPGLPVLPIVGGDDNKLAWGKNDANTSAFSHLNW